MGSGLPHKTLASKKDSFLRKLIKSAPVILVITYITLFADHAGWLKGFETSVLDTFLILKPAAQPEHVVIVGITDEDYRSFFQADDCTFNVSTLEFLIDVISDGQPRVIGVDFDTSGNYLGTSPEAYKDFKLKDNYPPTVWSKDGEVIEKQRSLWSYLNVFEEDQVTIKPNAVLGGFERHPDPISGIALMPQDADKSIRNYNRRFLISADDNRKEVEDSFHWAIVKKFCEGSNDLETCREVNEAVNDERSGGGDLILNLSNASSFRIITAGELLSPDPETATGQSMTDLFKDKVVLIGGVYELSGDLHYTPLGEKYGVELVANAIESELKGKGIRSASKAVLICAEILTGILMVFFNYKFPIAQSNALGILELPLIDGLVMLVVALSLSFLVFSSFALWASFVPMIVSVRLHNYYEQLKESWEYKREVENLKSESISGKTELTDSQQEDSVKVIAPPEARAIPLQKIQGIDEVIKPSKLTEKAITTTQIQGRKKRKVNRTKKKRKRHRLTSKAV